MPEAALATLARVQGDGCHQGRRLERHKDKLGDPVRPSHLVALRRVRVHQYDRDLTPVSRVDQAGGVEAGDAVAGGKAAPREDQPGHARRQLERDARPDHRPASVRCQHRPGPGVQVNPGITGAGRSRDGQLVVEADDWNLRHAVHGTGTGHYHPGVLAWMDLEMTGLDPGHDVIVEMATVMTDDFLNIVAEGPDVVVGATAEQLGGMEEIVQRMHTSSGLLEAIGASRVTIDEAVRQTLDFVRSHVPSPGEVPLCGNSIGVDRRFLRRYAPELEAYFHYRSIDVSTLKELCRRWAPVVYAGRPQKLTAHRALDDVRESIAELRYYKENFLSPSAAAVGAAPSSTDGAPTASS